MAFGVFGRWNLEEHCLFLGRGFVLTYARVSHSRAQIIHYILSPSPFVVAPSLLAPDRDCSALAYSYSWMIVFMSKGKRHSSACAVPGHRCAHPVPTTLPLLMLSDHCRCFPLSCSVPCILVQPMPPCHPSPQHLLLCSPRLPAPAPNPLLPPPSASSISSVGAGHSTHGRTMFLHSLAHLTVDFEPKVRVSFRVRVPYLVTY